MSLSINVAQLKLVLKNVQIVKRTHLLTLLLQLILGGPVISKISKIMEVTYLPDDIRQIVSYLPD